MSDLKNDNQSSRAMTPEELGRYKELLSAAYPYEKGKVCDSVMARIAKEAAAPKKNKPSWRTLAIRWGGAAAALLFICVISVSLLPRLDKFAAGDMYTAEADNSAVMDDARPESSGGVIDKTSSTSAPAEAPEAAADNASLPSDAEELAPEYEYRLLAFTAITEDGAGYDLADCAWAEELAPPSASADDSAAEEIEGECESVCETAYNVKSLSLYSASAYPVSTITECAHSQTFMNSYHEIPALLQNLVGADEYAAWEGELEDVTCKNIAGFIEHFGVEREIFSELVTTTDLYYVGDYPIDLLYGGDADAVEKYYSEGGDTDACLARYFEYKFKLALGEHAEGYNAWRASKDYDSVAAWSIAQLVHDLDVERDELEAVYAATAESFREIYADAKLPEYDFDAITECGHEIRRAITGGALGHEVDALYRK